MTEELKSAMREASKSLSAAIEDMADKVNAVLASRDMKMAARSVLADKLRKAASRKDLNWQTLFDALCVKSRSEAVAALAAMIDPKGILTERERHILDMWPRFEGGEPVWFGDSVEHDGAMETVQGFKLYRCGPAYLSVVGIDTEKWLRIEDYKSVKRPAPKVLDADGVEIKAGDTVWHEDGSEWLVEEVDRYGARCFDGDKRRTFNPKYLTHTRPATKVLDADGVEIHVGDTVWHCIGIYDELVVEEIDDESGWVRTRSANGACLSVYNTHLTHTRPDSWERLEEDAEFNDETGIVGGNLDIMRRAKALAGVEVGR